MVHASGTAVIPSTSITVHRGLCWCYTTAVASYTTNIRRDFVARAHVLDASLDRYRGGEGEINFGRFNIVVANRSFRRFPYSLPRHGRVADNTYSRFLSPDSDHPIDCLTLQSIVTALIWRKLKVRKWYVEKHWHDFGANAFKGGQSPRDSNRSRTAIAAGWQILWCL